MNGLAWRDLLIALALLVLVLWGDAVVDWLTPGRIDARVEALEAERAERSHMVRRGEHPHGVWERICVDGQNWIGGGCE
jgi:hypothetical protein